MGQTSARRQWAGLLTAPEDPAGAPHDETLAVLQVGRARNVLPSDDDRGLRHVAESMRRAAAELGGAAFGVEPDSHGLALPAGLFSAETLKVVQDLVEPPGDSLRTDRHRWAVHVGPGSWREALTSAEAVTARTAALCAVAHPGQVVMTDAAATGWQARAGPDLVDLGTHRLPDLGAPERVWQLGATAHPPLRSLVRARCNLPAVLTPLTGRGDEVAQVVALLDRRRLVTLTGSAGVGKTRLATAVAARVAVQADLVRVAWLGAVTDASGVGRAVLQAFGLPDAPGRSLGDRVAAMVGDRRTLLLLDGCEQAGDHVLPVAVALLSGIPALSVLATGLEPLGVIGEVVWRVPSLSYPSEGAPTTDLMAYAGVRLFVDRASRARPGLTLTAEPDLRAVAEICRRLDGIPLAVELAAAHCRHLAVTDLVAQLRRQLRLVHETPDVLGRGRTMAASLAWSHGRLSPTEHTVFRRLAPFVGRFPPAAAEQVVTALDDLPAEAVLDGLDALVDKSLLVHELHDGPPGYRSTGIIRAHALDRAAEAGELDRLRDAHAAYWAAWLRPLSRSPSEGRLAEVEHWFDELLQALSWWSTRRPAEALDLLDSLARTALDIGRADAVVDVSRPLLTAETAEKHPQAWLEAASAMALRYDLGRFDDVLALRCRFHEVACRRGDAYHLAVADFLLESGPEPCRALVTAAAARREPWIAALAASLLVEQTAAEDPSAIAAPTARAERLVLRAQSAFLTTQLARARGRAARDLGAWGEALARAEHMLASRSVLTVAGGADLARQVGLLTGSREVLETTLRSVRRSPSAGLLVDEVEDLRHALGLLDGTAVSRVNPRFDGLRPLAPGSLWLVCREAVDAGDVEVALTLAARNRRNGPFADAVEAAVEGAARRDPECMAAASRSAATLGLVVLAVDALERLAVVTATAHPAEAAQLMSCAESVRARTGYVWRFSSERAAAARLMDGVDAHVALGPGRTVSATSWRDDVEAVLRGRGPRDRPRFGWSALTPTELRVAEMVAEGHTNPEIALRLRVARATVKSHLDNVFLKLGVHSRAQVAAEYVRRR